MENRLSQTQDLLATSGHGRNDSNVRMLLLD